MSAQVQAARAALATQEVEFMLDHIQEESEAQVAIGKVMIRHRQALVSQDKEELQASLEASAEAVKRLEASTRNRHVLLVTLGRRVGLPEDDLQISGLLPHMPQSYRPRVEASLKQLATTMRQTRHITRQARMLAKSGLALNRSIVHTLFGDGSKTDTYDSSASVRKSAPLRPFFDREL